MAEKTTIERVKIILSELADIAVKNIEDTASIVYDLGVGSMETYDLLAELEVEFSIKIPGNVFSKVETVEDIVSVIDGIVQR